MSDKSLFVDWRLRLFAPEVRTICVSRWIGAQLGGRGSMLLSS
jgi:hypothetical protein